MRKIKKLMAMLLTLCMLCMGVFTANVFAAGFNAKVTVSAQGEAAEGIAPMLENSFFQLSGDQGADGSILNAQLSLSGMDLLRLLLQLKEDSLIVSLPQASETSYSISAQRLQELLGEFLNMIQEQSGGTLSLDGIAQQLEGLGGLNVSSDEITAAIAPYMQLLSDFITENTQMEENATVELENLGQTVEGVSLAVCQPTDEALVNLFNALADQMENDENLDKVVNAIADYIRSMSSVFEMADPGSGATADESANSLISSYEEIPGQLREAAASITENGLNGTITLTVANAQDGIVKVRFEAVKDGEETPDMAMGFETCKDETGAARVCLYMDNMGQSMKLLTTNTNSGNQVVGTVSLQIDGAEMLNVVYNWDLSQTSMMMVPYGTCVISFQGMSLSLIVTADGNGGDNHTIQLSGASDMTGGIDSISINLNTSKDAQVEAPSGEIVDISGYSMDELVGLVQELAGNYMNYIGSIFGGSAE